MKKIDITTWKRKQHFEFFSTFDEPYFGVTFTVNVTKAKEIAKTQGVSLFAYYLHKSLVAASSIENFCYRITPDNNVVQYPNMGTSCTIMRANETFAFSDVTYSDDVKIFAQQLQAEIDRIQQCEDLFPPTQSPNVMHCSAIPWLDFTSVTHSRLFSERDGTPKMSYGKITFKEGLYTMPVAVYVHHGLVDGLHVSRFSELFQSLLDGA